MLKIVNVKQTLADSLIELSYSKPISKITVQNIVDNCHTVRQTFYNHFSDKYDLINWIYKTKAERVLDVFKDNKNWYECIKNTYIVFYEDKQFFTKISNLTGQNSFVDFFYEHTKNYYVDSIISRYGKDEISESLLYSIEFNCYGEIQMCLKWIREGMKETPEHMAKHNIENIPSNLKRYFE